MKINKVEEVLRNTLHIFAVTNLILLMLNFELENFSSSLPQIFHFYGMLFCYGLFVLGQLAYIKNRLFSRQIVIVCEVILFFTFFFFESRLIFVLFIIFRQIGRFLYIFAIGTKTNTFFKRFYNKPAIFVVSSFTMAIFLGAILLKLPLSVVKGNISFLDAFFTSTSAICVTGLVVKDTYTYFTLFGQIIILSLIQIGGLGIMTISTMFALMMGEKLNLAGRSVVGNVSGMGNISVASLIRKILLLTFTIEIIGAIILYYTFRGLFPNELKSVYFAIFHSISSFCNAGFSLYSSSFMSLNLNWYINTIIPLLIILGGIGFPCLIDIINLIKQRRAKFIRLNLHSKIVLSSTVILIVWGALFYYFAETNYSMSQMTTLGRLKASVFQSVSTRTCGFNTIDQTKLGDASYIMTLFLMFIGASPSSTGGGIKTTTIAIIFLAVISLLQGKKRISVFNRTIPLFKLNQVMALIAISVSILMLMIFVLFAIEPFDFKEIIFEAVSAFGTVGLTMGITNELSSLGRFVIMILMFFGRVGPLTLIFAFANAKQEEEFSYPVEDINIG